MILIKSHIREHKKCIISVKEENKRSRRVLTEKCGFVLANLLFKQILTDLRNENTEQIKTENKKLSNLWKFNINKSQENYYEIPIVNLSSFRNLSTSCLKFSLHQSFVDKNKFIKRDIAIELESVAEKLDNSIGHEQKEEFHEYLRKYTEKLSKNIADSKR